MAQRVAGLTAGRTDGPSVAISFLLLIPLLFLLFDFRTYTIESCVLFVVCVVCLFCLVYMFYGIVTNYCKIHIKIHVKLLVRIDS